MAFVPLNAMPNAPPPDTGGPDWGGMFKTGLSGIKLASGLNSLTGANIPGLETAGSYAGPIGALLNFGTALASGNPVQAGLSGVNALASGIGAANAGLLGSNAAGLVAPIAGAASWAAAPLAIAAAVIGSGMEHQANRLKNLGHERGQFGQTYRGLMPRLAAGARDYDDPLQSYQYAMEGLAGVPQASSAAGHSGTTVDVAGPLGSKSFQFPDYTNTIRAERALIPRNVANLIESRDALARAGADFSAAPTEHVDLGAAGAYDEPVYSGPRDPRRYGNLSATELFKQALPYSGAGKSYEPGEAGHRGGSFDAGDILYQEHAKDAEGNDITLGDWKVRGDIQKELDALKPGEYESGLNTIFKRLNPNYSGSALGRLLG